MKTNKNDKQAEPVAVDHSGLIKRIDAAIERVTQGRGLMSIPADPRSDVDLVLSECKALLEGKNPPFWATDFHPPQPVALDVGNLEYMGNSVSFIYQKMRAHKDGIGKVWQALRDNGIHPDGQTHAADAIRKALAQPARQVQPEKRMLVCCPQCKLVFDGKSNRLNSEAEPVQADGLRQAALIDLAYINGAKAGWNMCVADDESQFKKLTEGVVECVKVLKNTRSQATPQPVQSAGAQETVLQRVMGRLADLLDEDQFAEIEGIVVSAGIAPPPPAVAVDEQFAVLIKKANDQAEHFEREWYLRGDELEALEQVNAQLLEALKELMYARTDKAEGMAEAAIAAAEAAKGGV